MLNKSKSKIKIIDNKNIREDIEKICQTASKIDLARWSLSTAKRILENTNLEYKTINEIVNGFYINELWQMGKATIQDVRQASFMIHKLAREGDNEIHKTALRVAGQAVASGHMAEHAIISSDYAVKAIGLMFFNDMEAISNERKCQLNELINICMCEKNV